LIEATIKMTVPVEKRKEVLQTAKAILGPIRRECGCISCNCYVDVENESVLFHVEPDFRVNTITSTAGPEAIKAARA
jgi:quinol monooxygenase YgiN